MILTLAYPFAVRGASQHLRSDNGSNFVAQDIQRWLKRAEVNTLYIHKGSPWKNGYVKSFNGKLRDELLNRKLFLSPAEAKYVLDEWRLDYNHRRPHSALGWQMPAVLAANLKAQEDIADGASPPAMQADPPVGAAPLPPDQPARSLLILSQGLVQKSEGGSRAVCSI